MKISFDAQLLIKGNKTGIGWCAENLLLKLKHNEGVKYQLNCFTRGSAAEQLTHIEKYQTLGYQVKKCTWFYDWMYKIIANFIYLPYSLFFGSDSDITVFFNYIIPPGVKGKKIVFVYDMVYKAHPETVRSRTKNMLKLALKKSCERADHIITISEFSKKEIIKYLNIPENKISIMPCGVDLSLYHPSYSKKEVSEVSEKYGLPNDYLLYLGTLEPRKNIVRLVEAYALLRKENANIPKLVLAGGKGWIYDSIFETIRDKELENDIIFTGYVSDVDVPKLMRGAKAFLFPSLYEGFGMPPLEAMACGTPVLVSNTASLPEVVGTSAVMVDPLSVESIKDGINSLVNNDQLRAELSQRGPERAKMFMWEKSAQILQDIIEIVI